MRYILKQGYSGHIAWPCPPELAEFDASAIETIEIVFRQNNDANGKEILRLFADGDLDAPVQFIDGDEGEPWSLFIPISKEETYLFAPGKFYFDVRITDSNGDNPIITMNKGLMANSLFES